MSETSINAAGQPTALIRPRWWGHGLWVLAGIVTACTVSAVFAGVLRLPRSLYLVPYVAISSALLLGYLRWSRLDLKRLFATRWVWGVAGAVLAGAFSVRTVLEQPASAHPTGLWMAAAMFWPGLAYGTIDGLLLSVFPIVGTWQALRSLGWTERWPGRLAAGLLSLLASIAMIGAYHLGYPEFRGAQVLIVMLGVGIQSLLCLIAGNPLPAVLGHIAMHLAAVWHGMESVAQLPPHY